MWTYHTNVLILLKIRFREMSTCWIQNGGPEFLCFASWVIFRTWQLVKGHTVWILLVTILTYKEVTVLERRETITFSHGKVTKVICYYICTDAILGKEEPDHLCTYTMQKLRLNFLKFFHRESNFCRSISYYSKRVLHDRKPFSNRDLIPGWCSKSENSHGQSALSLLQDLHNWPHTGDALKESLWCLQNIPAF